ncbi:helix-turn-helix domain-containing protein [Spirochaeta dissipatitropha]
MQKKTIGSFLAALRKANGMTQQDLADKLNVSNKAISRWERDECAPDIIQIPVIAEIFGITSDELLRGERSSMNQNENQNNDVRKPEKQLRYLLNNQLTGFRTATFISFGLSIVGLIALFISGYGFYKAVLGFGLSLLFYTASIINQAIFTTRAISMVEDHDFEGKQLQDYRKTVYRLSMKVAYVNIFTLCISLPLLVIRDSSLPSSILNFSSWLAVLPAMLSLAYLLCVIVSLFADRFILHNKEVLIGEKTTAGIRINYTHKKRLFIGAILMIGITFLIQIGINGSTGPAYFAEGIYFESFDDFKDFAETPTEYNRRFEGDIAIQRVQVDQDESMIHERHRSTDPSGENSYLHLNETISMIQWKQPIVVYTRGEIARGHRVLQSINMVFIIIYILEILSCLLVYFRKRVRVQ